MATYLDLIQRPIMRGALSPRPYKPSRCDTSGLVINFLSFAIDAVRDESHF